MGKKPRISTRAISFFNDLIMSLLARQGGQILMTPGVTTNLMAFIVHALNQNRIACFKIIDLAFPSVIPNKEKCCRDILGFKQIKQIRCIYVRAIVECKSHLSGKVTISDANAVWIVTELRSRH